MEFTTLQVKDFRTDSDLIKGVAQSQNAAITTLYRAHADTIFRFVYRRVEERYEDAQEITQDTFISALNLASTFRGESSILTWLCGIARLRITDFYRKQHRDKRVPPGHISPLQNDTAIPEPSLETVFERLDASQLVDRLMSLLAEDEREAMLLRYVEQFSVKDISALMGRTEKGIESLLSRAKSKLRESLIGLEPA